jgi:transposase InsO family protein
MLSGMSTNQGTYMGKLSRADYFRVARRQYKRANKKKKGELLDVAMELTGLHRKVVARHLRAKPTKKKTVLKRPDHYSAETKQAVRDLWHATSDIAAERLHPFIPELLDKLVSCGELAVTPETDAQLRKISLATVKRIVRTEKRRSTIRIGGTTKPGSLLKRQITVRYGRWDETNPGWCETDTVAHCGEELVGTFIYSLNLVDIATSWSEQVAVMGKGERAVTANLDGLRARLPFPLLGLDMDNGSEFINWSLHAYAKKQGITLTRSRPYRKNDQAHVEQKNWTAIRQLVGYQRMDTQEQLELLNDLYANEWRLYLNFFQPTMKVKETTKDQATGKKTKRYYPAQTPYQRLMSHPKVSDLKKAMLQSQYDSLNPVQLRAQIQRKLTKLAKTFGN